MSAGSKPHLSPFRIRRSDGAMQRSVVRVRMQKQHGIRRHALFDPRQVRLTSSVQQRMAFELVTQLLLKLPALKQRSSALTKPKKFTDHLFVQRESERREQTRNAINNSFETIAPIVATFRRRSGLKCWCLIVVVLTGFDFDWSIPRLAIECQTLSI